MESLNPQPPRTFREWLLSILSEESGHGSWSRVQGAITLSLSMALVWVSTLLGCDIPPMAQTVLLGLLAASGVGYGVNQVAGAIVRPEAP